MFMSGIVFFVGAGPGDSKLITLRGKECLEHADVVVYDRLVSPALLEYAKPNAELIYVGKSPEGHTMKQADINALLIQKAKQGKTVCRLKGGDPFVFGRGGEEAEALSEADIPFEVVPGITSAIAAPACAGIPITDRRFASSFAVATGHEDPTKGKSQKAEGETQKAEGETQKAEAEWRNAEPSHDRQGAEPESETQGVESESESESESERGQGGQIGRATSVKWEKLASAADTLIVLMGVEQLEEIANQMIFGGRSPQTPAALIHWASTPRQKVVVSELASIAHAAREAGLKPPSVLVVGDVVRLRERLTWLEKKPLFGKRVLITRDESRSETLADKLEALGAEAVRLPLIKVVPSEDMTPLDEAIKQVTAGKYNWLIFTSANGVRVFFERLRQHGLDARCLHQVKVCAIGPATAKELEFYGIVRDALPSRFVSEGVVELFASIDLKGKRVLLPRAQAAREVIVAQLTKRGAQVEEVGIYKTVTNQLPEERIEAAFAEPIDIFTFTSPSTVRGFVELVGKQRALELTQNTCVACIGPVTAHFCRQVGMTPTVIAQEHTVEGLVEGILGWMAGKRGNKGTAE